MVRGSGALRRTVLILYIGCVACAPLRQVIHGFDVAGMCASSYSGLICNCSPNVVFEGTTRRRTTGAIANEINCK